MDSLKHRLVQVCQNTLTQKIRELTMALKEVTEAGNNETKSTAGDKHETGRAMMQLEQEKLGKQLQEAEGQLAEFEKIDFARLHQTIALGSLIETTRGFFFITLSIGKMDVDGTIIFAISPQSPLGALLIGKKQKDTVVFNGVSYEINNIG